MGYIKRFVLMVGMMVGIVAALVGAGLLIALIANWFGFGGVLVFVGLLSCAIAAACPDSEMPL